jgi:hypothetical protein
MRRPRGCVSPDAVATRYDLRGLEKQSKLTFEDI